MLDSKAKSVLTEKKKAERIAGRGKHDPGNRSVQLAQAVLRYFGPDEIDRFLDGDVLLRDMALGVLGASAYGHSSIPRKVYRELSQ